MKHDKTEAFDEVNDIPEVHSRDVPRLKEIYRQHTGKAWPLSDEDIVNIIAMSSDDKVDEDWLQDMLTYGSAEPGKLVMPDDQNVA